MAVVDFHRADLLGRAHHELQPNRGFGLHRGEFHGAPGWATPISHWG
jgi:hypothetical protein